MFHAEYRLKPFSWESCICSPITMNILKVSCTIMFIQLCGNNYNKLSMTALWEICLGSKQSSSLLVETRPCVLEFNLWGYFQKCARDQIHPVALSLHLDVQGPHRGQHSCAASFPRVSIEQKSCCTMNNSFSLRGGSWYNNPFSLKASVVFFLSSPSREHALFPLIT